MESSGLHFKFGWRYCKAETPSKISRSTTELGSCWVLAGATIIVWYLELHYINLFE